MTQPEPIGLVYTADCPPIAVAGPGGVAKVARRLLLQAGVETIGTEPICTRCEPELFFSHRRNARARRQAGLPGSTVRGPELPGLIHGLDPAKIAANLERVRERGRRGGRDPRRDQVRAARGDGGLAEAGIEPGRREPPAGPRGEARALGRRLLLGLHRQPAEPQGQAPAAALPADPLGRHRLGARELGQSRRSRAPRSLSRSTSPARRARAGSRPPSSATSSTAARSASPA